MRPVAIVCLSMLIMLVIGIMLKQILGWFHRAIREAGEEFPVGLV